MAEETKHIYLFNIFGIDNKYMPVYDTIRSIPSHLSEVGYKYGKMVDVKGKRLVFCCNGVDEGWLRSHDVLVSSDPSKFIFVKERIFNCLEHLLDKDIQVIPVEIYCNNNLVEG